MKSIIDEAMCSDNLILCGTDVKGIDLVELGAQIERCTDLTSLTVDLQYIQYTATELQQFGSQIVKCKDLTSLNLDLRGDRDRYIGGEYEEVIYYKCPHTWTQQTRYICVENNGPSLFGQEISQFLNLTSLTLNLSFNKIENEDIKQFGYQLSKITTLTSLNLDLQYNSFDSYALDEFGEYISMITTLTSLNLDFQGNSQIYGVAEFGKYISMITTLTSLNLNLSRWQFYSDDAILFGQYIMEMENLISLNLNISQKSIHNKIKIKNILRKMKRIVNLIIKIYDEIDNENR